MPAPHPHRSAPALLALRHFAEDRGGSTALMFALALTPVVLVTGMAIDYSRASKARTEVQSLIDAAVLAAARVELVDATRPGIADDRFRAALPAEVSANLASTRFVLDETGQFVEGSASLAVPTAFAGILGMTTIPYSARARAAIARPQVRALDLVMCIDATGSMQTTLNAVKSNASTFDTALNAEMAKRNIAPFDMMRVRVIYYRDFGGNEKVNSPSYVMRYTLKSSPTYKLYLDPNPYDDQNVKNNNKNNWNIDRVNKNNSNGTQNTEYLNYYGDVPALKSTGMMTLPAETTAFRGFVNSEAASGGGDLPESGLECVNEAMASPWLRKGDRPLGLASPLEAAFPVIVTWTDAAAHAPDHPPSTANLSYPPATTMPRSISALLTKWKDAATIDQENKLLVFFGNPSITTASSNTAADGTDKWREDGWKQVATWPGFYLGGTLNDGNTKMITRIADAVASKVKVPALSH